MATHSSVLAWRIPGTAEPGGLPSMGWHRVGHNWSDLAAAVAFSKTIWVQNRTFTWFIRSTGTKFFHKMIWKENESHSVMSDSLQAHGLYSLWNSLGQNTGVGSLSLLQRMFPTQGLNLGLPHCREILYQLSCKGSPILAKLHGDFYQLFPNFSLYRYGTWKSRKFSMEPHCVCVGV